MIVVRDNLHNCGLRQNSSYIDLLVPWAALPSLAISFTNPVNQHCRRVGEQDSSQPFCPRLYVVVIWTRDSFLFSLSENQVISECELILNHAGVSCTKEEQMKMVVCPKHHFTLTTLFRPKVIFISCNSNFVYKMILY